MLGLTLAPLTGVLVADLLGGVERAELPALDPARFRRNGVPAVPRSPR
jgi:glycine/D-amino acid oxidase-like deaminating enzyme